MSAAGRRIALGLFVALAAFVSLFLRGDEPPPLDADLLPRAQPVAEHENGFLALLAAAELLRWPEGEAESLLLSAMSRGEVWNERLARRALAENAAALASFARVARSPSFQSPEQPEARGAGLAEGVRLAQLVALRAFGELRAKDPFAAREDALLLLRTARSVAADAHGGLLSAEAAFAVAEPGLLALERALPALAADPEGARDTDAALVDLRTDPEAWRHALSREYAFERARILAANDDPAAAAQFTERELRDASAVVRRLAHAAPRAHRFQPHDTLVRLAGSTRLAREHAAESCAPAGDATPVSLGDLLRPNPVGRHHVRAASSRTRVAAQRCRHDARIALVRAALGALRFEHERGALPDDLAALRLGSLASPLAPPDSGLSLTLDATSRRLRAAWLPVPGDEWWVAFAGTSDVPVAPMEVALLVLPQRAAE